MSGFKLRFLPGVFGRQGLDSLLAKVLIFIHNFGCYISVISYFNFAFTRHC